MAIYDIQRKWFVLQENSQKSTPVVDGPYVSEADAIAGAQLYATKQPGVSFSVARITTAFMTDDPKVTQQKFVPAAGV